jgi:hypothetical protein
MPITLIERDHRHDRDSLHAGLRWIDGNRSRRGSADSSQQPASAAETHGFGGLGSTHQDDSPNARAKRCGAGAATFAPVLGPPGNT